EHGRTEVVRVELELKNIDAEEFQPQVKRMLSKFGEVNVIAPANLLILQDTAGNLQTIVNRLKKIEDDNTSGSAEVYSYVCRFIRARDADRILTDLLGD